MNATEMKALLQNEFLYYEEYELDLDIDFLTKKMANPRCSSQQKKKASDDLSAVFAMKELFEVFQKMGLDTDGMSGAMMLETMSGRTVGELQSSLGTTAVLGVKEGAMKAYDVSKKQTNRFAKWLTKVTE